MINYDLTKIKLLIFDIDGVLSATTIPIGDDGQPIRTANIKDGYAIQLAIKLEMPVAIITGGSNETVRRRYESLGCRDVCMGSSVKLETYEALLKKYGIDDENVHLYKPLCWWYGLWQRCDRTGFESTRKMDGFRHGFQMVD